MYTVLCVSYLVSSFHPEKVDSLIIYFYFIDEKTEAQREKQFA